MPYRNLSALIACVFIAPTLSAVEQVRPAHDYPVQPVPFTAVHLRDFFWAPKIETNRQVTIPFAFKQCEDNGRLYNFDAAAAAIQGHPYKDPKMPGFPFDDTDIYKVLEGASYSLSVHPDPALDAYLDMLIAKIAAAQEKDGYLYTARTMNPEHPHEWAGPRRWEMDPKLSHELYNLGHLYEAAVAHYQATGKRSLLDIALRTADLLDRTFGPGKQSIWPGHQIVEMGLAKLYRVTGDERYLRLTKFILDARGPSNPHSGPYNQSHQPVVDQTEAVGHAVRAGYMYSGMADVAALTGDPAYIKAIDKIWEDVAEKKLYLTGGIGARHDGEAFGAAYELPNDTAYNETCAAIANVYWNQRLFLLHGDAKYVDVLERSLYNGVISGVSLDGKAFFYPNPLESKGDYERKPWFGCACCPSNMTRFIASVSGYQYAVGKDRIYVNLFATGQAQIALPGGKRVAVSQATGYPWDGDIVIDVNPEFPTLFSLCVRIPGWARGEVVAGDLYRFSDLSGGKAPTLTVNGKAEPIVLDIGYAVLNREWKKGDVVFVSLPMPARRVLANAKVAADVGRVALQRGPLVYCLESHDNPGIKVREAALGKDESPTAEFRPNLLGGVTVLRTPNLTAIPYYAWANRGKAEMAVWLRQ